MRVGIMQPYFFPYIGYFQLIAAVDLFIVYDNIKYTKKGWINRNRYLLDGGPATFTVPVAHASDTLDIRDRRVAESFDRERQLHRIRTAYRHAPHRERALALFEACVRHHETNLFRYIHHSIRATCNTIGIQTPIVVSSTVDVDHDLTAQDKVLALCTAVGATEYLNPIGGRALYDRETFASRGVSLSFLEARSVPYPQSDRPFTPFLSILDVLMHNDELAVAELLKAWDPR